MDSKNDQHPYVFLCESMNSIPFECNAIDFHVILKQVLVLNADLDMDKICDEYIRSESSILRTNGHGQGKSHFISTN